MKWIIASAIILPSFALLVLVDRGDRDFLYLGAVLVGSLFPVTFLFVRKGFSFPLGSWAVAVFACLMVALPHFLCSADLYPFQAERGEKWEGKSLDSLVVLEKEHSRIRQKKVLLFYTKDCHFCRISLRKTTAFIRRHQLDLGQFLIVSPESSREGFSDFLRNSPLPFQVEFVNGTRFFSVVRNSTPLILLQTPTGPLAWRYRDFDDTEVARQLAIP